MLIHFVVVQFSHRDLPSYTSLDLGRILNSIAREDLHQVGKTNCATALAVNLKAKDNARGTFGRVWWNESHPDSVLLILLFGLSAVPANLLLLLQIECFAQLVYRSRYE